MLRLDIRLLGPLEICRDGRPVKLPGRKVRALLAALALDGGRTVSFDTLGRALWHVDPPERIRGSLQTYAGRLRRALGDDVLVTEPSGYRLDVPASAVDVLRFRELLDAPGPDELRTLDAALSLWRGDPFGESLSEWFDDHEAPALVERYLSACERRIDLEAASGDHLTRIPELQELTARHSLRETLWLRLLSTLRDAGRKAEALDRYEALRSHLADELGVDPGPELQAIHRDLVAVRRPSTRLPPKSPPHDLTRFFGRDAELARLDRLLQTSRLVTIAGPPGAGKTRLSREYAARAAAGAVLVELASAPTVAAGIASALGLEPGETIAESADLLLVLDNCEHVAAAAAQQAEQILAACPAVRILATSRVPLGTPGEHVYRLPPMKPATAIALFTDRARLVCGDFPLRTRVTSCRRSAGAWTRCRSPLSSPPPGVECCPRTRCSIASLLSFRASMAGSGR